MIVVNGKIGDIRLGDEAIKSVYTGDDLVWEKKERMQPLILEYTVGSGDMVRLPVGSIDKVVIDWGGG